MQKVRKQSNNLWTHMYAACVQQTLSIHVNSMISWTAYKICRQFTSSALIVQTQNHSDGATAQWTPAVQRCNSIRACAAEARVSARHKRHCSDQTVVFIKPCPHWRLQSPKLATVAVFGNSRRICCWIILRHIVAVSDSYSLQCGQGLRTFLAVNAKSQCTR